MKLSICTIFRDEERFLPEYLTEHSGLPCELILVDTGSTDSSLRICQEFQAKTLSYSWNNNFSKAKNFAIDQATGDWILFLDADERIPKAKLLDLIQQLPQLSAQAYRLELISTRDEYWKSDTPNLESIQWHVRLFRNQPNYRYRHAIHENIVESLEESGAQILDLPNIQVFHLGYMDELLESKTLRNIPLIKSAFEQDPDDPRNLIYMAKCHRDNSTLFWNYLENAYENRSRGYLMDVCEEAFQFILQNEDQNKYKIWTNRILSLEPNHPSPILFQARLEYKNQKLEIAKELYEKVESNLRFFLHGNYHGEVYVRLALINAIQSRPKLALDYLDLESQWAKPNVDSWFLRLKLLFSMRKAQDFVNLLQSTPPNFNELDQRRLNELIRYINSIEFPNKSRIIERIENAEFK